MSRLKRQRHYKPIFDLDPAMLSMARRRTALAHGKAHAELGGSSA